MSRFTPMTDEELLLVDIPPTQWASHGLVPFPGLVALSGRPESYKTFFCLHVARQIALGKSTFEDVEAPVGKSDVGEPAAVLFIEDENSLNLMKERMSLLRGSEAVPGLYYLIQEGFKATNEEDRTELVTFCQEKGIRVIFMDPFSSVAGLNDENNNAEVAKVMDILRLEFVAKGISVVFIHHPSKGDEGGANLRGAGDILGKVDVHVTLERENVEDNENKRVIAKFAKMRIADRSKFENFIFQLGSKGFEYCGTVKAQKSVNADKLKGGVLIALMEGPLSSGELADRLKVNRSGEALRSCIKAMVEEGVMEKFGEGKDTKYRLKKTT